MKQTLCFLLLCIAIFTLSPGLSRAEDLADAIQDVVEEVERDPANADAQKRLGLGYILLARELGDNPARDVFGSLADFHLDQAVQLDPGDLEALELLGQAAVLNRDPSKAAAVYEDLVSRQTDPAEGRYLMPLHTCYQWLADSWRGVAFYRSQLERMPNWTQVKFLMATLLLDLDRGQALDIMWELAASPDTPDGLKATVRAALKEES